MKQPEVCSLRQAPFEIPFPAKGIPLCGKLGWQLSGRLKNGDAQRSDVVS
jgi:hypothetical protein